MKTVNIPTIAPGARSANVVTDPQKLYLSSFLLEETQSARYLFPEIPKRGFFGFSDSNYKNPKREVIFTFL